MRGRGQHLSVLPDGGGGPASPRGTRDLQGTTHGDPKDVPPSSPASLPAEPWREGGRWQVGGCYEQAGLGWGGPPLLPPAENTDSNSLSQLLVITELIETPMSRRAGPSARWGCLMAGGDAGSHGDARSCGCGLGGLFPCPREPGGACLGRRGCKNTEELEDSVRTWKVAWSGWEFGGAEGWEGTCPLALCPELPAFLRY